MKKVLTCAEVNDNVVLARGDLFFVISKTKVSGVPDLAGQRVFR
jgi:hypothetical protein